MSGPSIGFLNNKGGSAKTLTAVTTAACLRSAGDSVVLIDADPARGATKSLGFDGDVDFNGERVAGAEALFTPSGEVPALVHSTGDLAFVPGSGELNNFTLRHGQDADRELLFRKGMARFRKANFADFYLVDCPPDISLLTVNVLLGVDYFVVPVRPAYLDTIGLADLLSAVWALKKAHGRAAELLGVLLVDVPRTRHAREMSASVRRQLGSRVFATEVPHNARLAEAAGMGKTAFEHAPTSAGVDAYMAFSRELRHRLLSVRTSGRLKIENSGGSNGKKHRIA